MGEIDVGTARLRCGLQRFFLVVYATQIWGGVFPFLPTDFQTQRSFPGRSTFRSRWRFAHRMSRAHLGSYYVPSAARRMLVTLSISLTFARIVLYHRGHVRFPCSRSGFIVAGGAFLGVGCAGIFMLWQRYFSSISALECNWRLIAGTAFGPLLYFMLYLIPDSLTAFSHSRGASADLRTMSISFGARDGLRPIDVRRHSREHPQVYARMLHDFWRSAGGLGALAFAAGLARGVAIVEPDIQIAVHDIHGRRAIARGF